MLLLPFPLVVYHGLDTSFYRKEGTRDLRDDQIEKPPLPLKGWVNILWLGGIVACVATIRREREFIDTGWSLGPVFMGAITYTGNGASFMGKAIAEKSGIR